MCVGARATPAQTLPRSVEGSVDLGSAFLRQPDLPGSSVLTLASQLRYAGLRGALLSNGIIARTPENRFTGQGIVSGSLYAPPLQRLRWEVGGSASVFGLSGASPTTSLQGLARQHLTLESGGLFAGAGVSGTLRDGSWRPAFGAHAGGFYRFDPIGRDQLSASLAFIDADAARVGEASLRYADAFAFWEHVHSHFELLGGGGVRLGQRGVAQATPWASATAVWWVTPRVGFVASAGRALDDVVRGVPTVRYTSVALRIGFSERRSAAVPSRPHGPPEDDGAPRLVVSRGDDELRVIQVHAPADSLVEIMADFTDWEPVTLARDPKVRASWTLVCAISPGTHRVAIRIDGGEWIVPPNLPRVADDFGGAMGLLTVP